MGFGSRHLYAHKRNAGKTMTDPAIDFGAKRRTLASSRLMSCRHRKAGWKPALLYDGISLIRSD